MWAELRGLWLKTALSCMLSRRSNKWEPLRLWLTIPAVPGSTADGRAATEERNGTAWLGSYRLRRTSGFDVACGAGGRPVRDAQGEAGGHRSGIAEDQSRPGRGEDAGGGESRSHGGFGR